MRGKELNALILNAQRRAVSDMSWGDSLGMGEIGDRLIPIVENREFGKVCYSGLETAVQSYNQLEITPETESLFLASAKLKKKIPVLPLPSEMLAEIKKNRNCSRWSKNYWRGLGSLRDKILVGQLKWYQTDTEPKALAAGGVAHEFEEKILADKELARGQDFEIDEVVFALMEMLLWKEPDHQFCRWLCNPLDPGANGGLDWAADEHLSPALRYLNGYK